MWTSSDLQGRRDGCRCGVASGCWFGVACRCRFGVAFAASIGVVVARTTNGRAPRGQAAASWRPRSPAATEPGLQLGDPPLEEAPLALRACERERALERLARLIGPAEPAQQFAAGRVQVLVVAELKLLDDLERLLGRPGLGDRDRAVQLDHRGVRDLR